MEIDVLGTNQPTNIVGRHSIYVDGRHLVDVLVSWSMLVDVLSVDQPAVYLRGPKCSTKLPKNFQKNSKTTPKKFQKKLPLGLGAGNLW